jgi:hypothetical protein
MSNVHGELLSQVYVGGSIKFVHTEYVGGQLQYYVTLCNSFFSSAQVVKSWT